MMLNKNQKKVIWVTLGLIVLMGLFPPWICGTYTTPLDDLAQKPTGNTMFKESVAEYHFIFAPPPQKGYRSVSSMVDVSYVYRLDYGRLFLQWLMVVAVSGGLIFLFREVQKSKSNTWHIS